MWVGVQGLHWKERGCTLASFALRVEGGHSRWGRRAPGTWHLASPRNPIRNNLKTNPFQYMYPPFDQQMYLFSDPYAEQPTQIYDHTMQED